MECIPYEIIVTIIKNLGHFDIMSVLSSCSELKKVENSSYFMEFFCNKILNCHVLSSISCQYLISLWKRHPFNNRNKYLDNNYNHENLIYLNYVVNKYIGKDNNVNMDNFYNICTFMGALYPIAQDYVLEECKFHTIKQRRHFRHYLIQVLENALYLNYDTLHIIKLLKTYKVHKCQRNTQPINGELQVVCNCDYQKLPTLYKSLKNREGHIYPYLDLEFEELLTKYNRLDVHYMIYGTDHTPHEFSIPPKSDNYVDYVTSGGQYNNKEYITNEILITSYHPQKLLELYKKEFMENKDFCSGYNGDICELEMNEDIILGYLMKGNITDEDSTKLLNNDNCQNLLYEAHNFVLSLRNNKLTKELIFNRLTNEQILDEITKLPYHRIREGIEHLYSIGNEDFNQYMDSLTFYDYEIFHVFNCMRDIWPLQFFKLFKTN
ncbi:Hypothetical protein ORPV_500 [Orpheovirus IHUMI-LCC2]|uniref:F-box domain-containing protein n=1 Tax=Orpheovirus IHUMI-LCC2 TaxID=2023057 RepID=A0A2I2L4F2_9VIRU|nr:Hypothetical protein ORPV_500 [Orpheovirus IHUMI-LCC2]SNW62404.1 Hypothetical protein ORPV_500 [Orpheovirus IHUMI-LCC2]